MMSLTLQDSFNLFRLTASAAGIQLTPMGFRTDELDKSRILWVGAATDLFRQIRENTRSQDPQVSVSVSLSELLVLNTPKDAEELSRIGRPMPIATQLVRVDEGYTQKFQRVSKRPWRQLGSIK